jgi:hypothetical protein
MGRMGRRRRCSRGRRSGRSGSAAARGVPLKGLLATLMLLLLGRKRGMVLRVAGQQARRIRQ